MRGSWRLHSDIFVSHNIQATYAAGLDDFAGPATQQDIHSRPSWTWSLALSDADTNISSLPASWGYREPSAKQVRGCVSLRIVIMIRGLRWVSHSTGCRSDPSKLAPKVTRFQNFGRVGNLQYHLRILIWPPVSTTPFSHLVEALQEMSWMHQWQ